jgi:hypothetical protein
MLDLSTSETFGLAQSVAQVSTQTIAAGLSGSAPPPSPSRSSRPQASRSDFSHHFFSRLSQKDKDKVTAAERDDLNSGDESSSDSDKNVSSSDSDSDLSDVFFNFMHQKRQITTSSSRLSFEY